MGTPTNRPTGDADIRLLRVFRAVAECGGFSAAEAELDVARSTISTQIAALEARLGVRLCDRGRGGFALTAEGRLVYAEALELLGAIDAFRSRVEGAGRRIEGELSLAVIDNVLTLGSVPLPAVLRELRDRAPGVRVTLRVMAPDEIEAALLDGRVHAGVVPIVGRRRSALAYRVVAAETQHIYCGAGHPLFERDGARITRAEIEEHDFVGRSHVDEARATDRPFAARPHASANSLEAVLILVLSARYLGLLPTQYAAPWEREGRIRALRSDLVSVAREFALVTRRGAHPPPVLAAFLESFDFDSRGRTIATACSHSD